MKTYEIIRENEHYQIIAVERDDRPLSGSSKQGHIKAAYHDLVDLFGEPQNHTADKLADVNYEWDLTIKYKDPSNPSHAEDEEFDQVDVTIYDYRYNNESRQYDPAEINQWTVGSKTKTGLYVLQELLASKRI